MLERFLFPVCVQRSSVVIAMMPRYVSVENGILAARGARRGDGVSPGSTRLQRSLPPWDRTHEVFAACRRRPDHHYRGTAIRGRRRMAILRRPCQPGAQDLYDVALPHG